MLVVALPRAFRAIPANLREWSIWLRDSFATEVTGTIEASQIVDGSVTAAKLAGGIGTSKLGDDITAAGKALLDDSNALSQRTTLGLGTAATQNTGTSGANVPLLNGANTWSAAQTFSSAVTHSAPPVVPSYTVAGVPSATPAGQLAYISNESGGAVLAFSDATNWRRVTDRAIVS